MKSLKAMVERLIVFVVDMMRIVVVGLVQSRKVDFERIHTPAGQLQRRCLFQLEGSDVGIG